MLYIKVQNDMKYMRCQNIHIFSFVNETVKHGTITLTFNVSQSTLIFSQECIIASEVLNVLQLHLPSFIVSFIIIAVAVTMLYRKVSSILVNTVTIAFQFLIYTIIRGSVQILNNIFCPFLRPPIPISTDSKLVLKTPCLLNITLNL